MRDAYVWTGLGFWLVAVALGLGSLSTSEPTVDKPAEAAEVFDEEGRAIHPLTGLVLAEDWDLVASRCIRCHSAKQFLKQRGTRATWQGVIDWMQASQGLEQFPEGVEERIVDYLATHYAPGPASRRAPLPVYLMPRPTR